MAIPTRCSPERIVGIKNGDNITATFTSPATATSPVGTYPIIPALVDPTGKLGNYTVTVQQRHADDDSGGRWS